MIWMDDVDLYTVCFLLTFGNARGLGLNCACVPLVTRLYAVNKTMPRMWINLLCVVFFSPWGHVNWMPIFGSF